MKCCNEASNRGCNVFLLFFLLTGCGTASPLASNDVWNESDSLLVDTAVPDAPTVPDAPARPEVPSVPDIPPSPDAAFPDVVFSPGASFIHNASVEEGEGIHPDGWSPLWWGDMTASFHWPDGQGLHGRRSIQVQVMDHLEGDAYWAHDFLPLESGRFYRYESWYRSDGRSRIYLHLVQSDTGANSYFNIGQSHHHPSWKHTSSWFYLPLHHQGRLRVMHLLDRNGWLESDAHMLAQYAPIVFPEGAVTVFFDDIFLSAATLGAEELERRGLPGVFAVTRRFAENPQGVFASRDDVLRLIESETPHEIASHSDDHAFFSRMSDGALAADLRNSREFLQELGAEVSGLAYPFGDFDHRVEEEARKHYQWIRTSLYGLNDARTPLYRLRCFPVTNATNIDTMKSWIEQARSTNTWAIVLFHNLGPVSPDDPYTTPVDEYLQFLDYLIQEGVPVRTINHQSKISGWGR